MATEIFSKNMHITNELNNLSLKNRGKVTGNYNILKLKIKI